MPHARFQLADYYVRSAATDDAKKLLTELAKASPATSADAEAMLASLDYGSRTVARGATAARRGARKAPQNATCPRDQGAVADRRNKLDEALERAKAAVAADAKSATAHFALAAVHERRRETTEALTSYNEVLSLNPARRPRKWRCRA